MRVNDNLILKGTFRVYPVSRATVTGENDRGHEIKEIEKLTMSLSVHSNIKKLNKRMAKDTLKNHSITIYTYADIQLDDEVPYENKTYKIVSIDPSSINVCEAISNGK